MLAVCSSSQIAYCSTASDGEFVVTSKIKLTNKPLCCALAWDTTTNCLLLPTQSSLQLLDPAAKNPPGTLKTWKSAPISTLTFAGSKNVMYYCQNNKLITVEPRGQPRALTQGEFCKDVTAIQVSKNLDYIVCSSSSFWVMNTSKNCRETLEGIHNEGISSFCFSFQSNERLYATDKGDLLIYDLSTSHYPTKRHAVGDARVIAMAASPTQMGILALADSKGRIYVCDTDADTSST